MFDAKFCPPRKRAGHVSRSRCIARANASGAQIVTVVAPVGFGKSTLLSEWYESEPHSRGWVRLEPVDDDPAGLLSILVSVFVGATGSAMQSSSLLIDGASDPLGVGAPLLAAAFRRADQSFSIFVDDVHVLRDPGCADLLDIILDSVPEGSKFVLASESELAFLSRQRHEGRTFDMRFFDLQLDRAGARVVAESHGLVVSEGILDGWVSQCNGWPAGIFLRALLEAKGQASDPEDGGGEVAGYLFRSYLEGLPEGCQMFLMRTAVLTKLYTDVCDFLLESTESSRWLKEASERGFFVTPVCGEDEVFQCQDAFRTFLLEELMFNDPQSADKLHLRAAGWFAARAEYAVAIEHALQAGEDVFAARLVAKTALRAYQRGEVARLERWLARLSDRVLRESPWTTVVAVWVAILEGDVDNARRRATILSEVVGDSTGIEVAALRSQRAMLRAATRIESIEAGLEAAAFAAAYEPETSAWRDQAIHLHGVMLQLSGDSDAAQLAFEKALSVAGRMDNAYVVLLASSDLSMLAIAREDWDAARDHVAVAIGTVASHDMNGYGLSALPMAIAARIAVQRGAHADELIQHSMRVRERTTFLLPVLAVQVRLHLAYALIGLGNVAAAHAMLDEIVGILQYRPQLGTLRDDVRTLMDVLVECTPDDGGAPLDPQELRLMPYLQTHLTLDQIAGRLRLSRTAVSTQMASIYRKLDVRTRSSAVEKAKQHGMLGG